MAGIEGENRPQHKEIDKQLAQARRVDYRKESQAWSHYIPGEETPVEAAEEIVAKKQLDGKIEAYEQAWERLTPEEQERHNIDVGLDYLKQGVIMSHRITRALHYRDDLLVNMQQHDPEFMNLILTGVKKRPARQEKAKQPIQRGGIDPGVADYGDYCPLWDRF